MSDHAFPSPSNLDDELADWLLAHDRGLTEQEVIDFERWLRASPSHGRAWTEAATLWESLDFDSPSDEMAAMLDEARDAGRPSLLGTLPRRIALGGGLAAAFALSWVAISPLQQQHAGPPASPERQYAARYEAAKVVLPDGTHLTLDAGSALSYASLDGARVATLRKGRAYLDVNHDAEHPFRVVAGSTAITDVGTQFGVSSEGDNLSVTLVSGKVSIKDPVTTAGTIDLVPGQTFARAGDTPGRVTSGSTSDALSWTEGYVTFHSVPLAAAIARMNDYSSDPVQVDPRGLKGLVVSGRFKSGDPVRFARTLSLTYPVELIKNDKGQYVLKRKH